MQLEASRAHGDNPPAVLHRAFQALRHQGRFARVFDRKNAFVNTPRDFMRKRAKAFAVIVLMMSRGCSL